MQERLQNAIAKDITIRVHSEEDYEMAVKASNILFGKSTTADLETLDEDTLLAVFEGVPKTSISQDTFESAENVTDLLTDASNNLVFPSKGEARRMIKGGGVSINKTKLSSAEQAVDFKLLQDKYLLAQKGKRIIS